MKAIKPIEQEKIEKAVYQIKVTDFNGCWQCDKDTFAGHIKFNQELKELFKDVVDEQSNPITNTEDLFFEYWKDEETFHYAIILDGEIIDVSFIGCDYLNNLTLEVTKELELKELWSKFEDIPMNPETEEIEQEWNTFPIGTHREEIWHWFEDTFNISVADLMYNQTKTLNLTVVCKAYYNSAIQVPINMTLEEAIEYAKNHLDEVNVGELEYISDSDELDEENCEFEK